MDQTKENTKSNPRDSVGFWSRITFSWLLPLLRLGKTRPLETEDLYRQQKEDSSQILGDLIANEWTKELEYASKAKRKPSYVRAISRCFGWSYFQFGLLAAIEECVLRISQPICLGGMIRYFNGESGLTELHGWLFACGLVLGSILYIFTHHPFFFGICHCGMQIRIASCSLLYRKALRLSKAALGKTTVGHMVNLLSNDVNRFDTSVIFLHYLWIGPLQLLICGAILWYEIGPSCIAGLILLILFVPFQSWMGKMFSRLRLATAHRTDERVRIMDEIINAIRVIKMYTWERPFTKLIDDARKSEINVIMETNYYRAVNMSLFFTSAKIIVFLALLTYVLTGNVLTAEKVFVTSALINNVRLVMTLFFPFGIAMGSETLISCKRIQEFLEMEEREETNRVEYSDSRPKLKDCYVEGKGVTAKWSDDTEEETLKDIAFSVRPKELLAIIGPVGAGKGSLLQAILGELSLSDGNIKVEGKIAYASQEPWVFSGTIRQNILFGQPFNVKRYHQVLKVCALETDIEMFPLGDQTLVGEKGVSLSGGQKARVNLARAVYFDADIYLLDDPLSAVDTHVGRHLYDQCIMGFLKEKVTILVTHQLQYLKNAHNILVLKEGRMEAQGNYHQLVNSGIDFASFMAEDQDEEQPPSYKQSDLIIKESDSFSPKPITRQMSILDNESGAGSRLSLSRRIREASVSLSLDEGSNVLDNLMSISALGLAGSEMSLSKVPMDSPILNRPKSKLRKPRPVKFDDEKSKPLIQEIESPCEKEDKEPSKNPDSSETKSTGSVSIKVYLDYFLAGGGWCLVIILFLANVMTQVLFSGSEYWLAYWTNGEQKRAQIFLNLYNITELTGADNETVIAYDEFGVPPGYLDTTTNVYIYSGMIASLFLLSLFRTVLFFVMCMKASRNLHKRMFQSVIRVPIKFFDTHPIGQILNRFTRDIGQVDELLPTTVFDVVTIFLNFVGIIVVITSLNYWILLPTAALGVIFVILRRFYLCTARDIKRLEGITRSPVFSHLSSSLLGLTTIRAFKAQNIFTNDFDTHQDLHSSAWFLFICTTRWFGICLDWISCIYIGIATFGFMFMTNVLGGDIGLAISQAMLLSGMFQWGVRQSAEVENQMTSVERVLEYSKLESEAPLEKEKDKSLDTNWPSKGGIKFKDVTLQYSPRDPPVLKQLNFGIKPTEKIGIVGRTGAGKSSLLTTLFRLTEPTGDILLDGVATHQLGLHKLRSSISIIPQDPTLFSGTLRHNIDPFSLYTDNQLWEVLEEVQLKEAICDFTEKLEGQISEGGSNLSVGQRQLVCLARAILKHNKILVMDEATANVDPKTDSLIQQTIRTKFADCTVLTIAHRLHTIMDSDRVMVMDAGHLKEFEEPHILLGENSSLFSKLVQQTGPATSLQLQRIAKEAFEKRNNLHDTSIPLKKTPVIADQAVLKNGDIIKVNSDSKITTGDESIQEKSPETNSNVNIETKEENTKL